MEPENGKFSDLHRQVAELTRRVYDLEQKLSARGRQAVGIAYPEASQEASTPETTVIPPRVVETPAFPPTVAAHPPAIPSDSFEARVGTHWFSYLGALAVIVGLAWFLKLAIDRGWIGPLERVLMGLAVGLVLIYLGDRCLRRGLAVSGFGLNGAGTGAIYLSLWAAHALYQLLPAPAVFVGLAAVTAYNGIRCWRDDSESFAVLALLGGFLIPALLANGQNHETLLFLFLVVLDIAIAVLAALKPWEWLLPAALTGTAVLGLGWYFEYFQVFAWRQTDGFIAIFIVLFSLAVRAMHEPRTADGATAPGGGLAIVMPLIIVLGGFGAILTTTIDSFLTHWRPWAAMLLAAFCIALYRLPSDESYARQRVWRWTQLGLALGLITVAIPLKLHGRQLILAWLVEGVAVTGLARRMRALAFIRAFALAALGLAVLLTLASNSYAGATPILNRRFATYLAAIAATAATAAATWLAAGGKETDGGGGALPWRQLALGLGLSAALLPLIAGYFEIYTWWWGGTIGGYVAGPELRSLQLGSQFTYSLWTMLYGAALLAAGFWKRLAPVRWVALILLAGAIAKVFLYDMSALSQGYRIVSFLGLGALLLAISYAYQRDWLGLRR